MVQAPRRKSSDSRNRSGAPAHDAMLIREANWFFNQRTVVLAKKHGETPSRAQIGMKIGKAGPGGDYSHAAIGKYELEHVSPPLADANRFAAAYEVSVEEMERQIVAQARRIRERQS